jgi:hypothetical protein
MLAKLTDLTNYHIRLYLRKYKNYYYFPTKKNFFLYREGIKSFFYLIYVYYAEIIVKLNLITLLS